MPDSTPQARRSPLARCGDAVHAIVFLGLLWLPLAAGLLGGRRTELAENRTLAPAPQLGVDRLACLPEKFDRYYRDHFGLRNVLIRVHDLIQVRGLRVYHSDQVAVGTDDWLFFLGDRVREDLQGLDPLSAGELHTWRQVLEGKQAWLAQQGIAYLFVVAPNKESIYPERVPATLRRPDVQTRLDQLVAHLRTHSSVAVLDLRPALRAARRESEVYHPLDTHWNDRGSLVAYQAICARLKGHVPALAPLRLADFDRVAGHAAGDLCAMIGWHSVARPYERLLPQHAFRARPAPLTLDADYAWPRWGPQSGPLATECAGATGHLVVFHDSFLAHRVRDFLSEHFRRAVYLPMRPNFDVLQRLVRQERPQLVIEEWVERTLSDVPTAHPQWLAARRDAAARLR
jgi:hypothetical protein